MNRILKFFFAALILVIFAEVLIYAPTTLEEQQIPEDALQAEGDQTQDSEDGDEGFDSRLRGEQILEEFHLVETKEEKKDWELFSQRAEGTAKQQRWILDDVKVIFYSTAQDYFTVTGKSGSIDLKSKDMLIEGEVKVVTSNGYILRSEKVIYNSEGRILESPGKVNILGPRDTDGDRLRLKGGRMRADVTRSEVVITDSVQADKVLSDGRKVRITSHRAEISGQSYKAEFYQNVKLRVNNLIAQGPKAVFQIDTQTKKLVGAEMSGGVAVSDSEKKAYSEGLSINLPADRMELTGHPRLVQGKDEIVGDVIVFLEGGKKVRVEDARARVRNDEELRR